VRSGGPGRSEWYLPGFSKPEWKTEIINYNGMGAARASVFDNGDYLWDAERGTGDSSAKKSAAAIMEIAPAALIETRALRNPWLPLPPGQ